MYSCSDMNKIKMGPATAVSHYHQFHFFLGDSPNFADHDLPNPRYLIICSGYQIIIKKLYGPFLWMGGSTASRLEPLRAGSLLFTTKFPEIPGTHFIDLGRMKG